MADFRLDAETRTEFGKGSARRTRRAGRVPAVLYGHGQAVQHLSLPAREFAAALRNGGTNVLLTVTLEGTEHLALTKSIQRDPLTRVHEHVDLLIVRRGEKVTVDIPITTTGDVAPETIINFELNTVSIEVPATSIPETIEVDIEGRAAGEGAGRAALLMERRQVPFVMCHMHLISGAKGQHVQRVQAGLPRVQNRLRKPLQGVN